MGRGDALLLIDWINTLAFPGGRIFGRRALPAARNTAALRSRLDRHRVSVIYANDHFGNWRSDFRHVVNDALHPKSNGRELAGILRPTAKDLFVLKPRHSAFYQTPLDELLAKLKPRRLILTGIATDICVLFTANDAYLRGYELWVPSDCVAAEQAAVQRTALAYMRRVCKADIRPSAKKGSAGAAQLL